MSPKSPNKQTRKVTWEVFYSVTLIKLNSFRNIDHSIEPYNKQGEDTQSVLIEKSVIGIPSKKLSKIQAINQQTSREEYFAKQAATIQDLAKASANIEMQILQEIPNNKVSCQFFNTEVPLLFKFNDEQKRYFQN